MIISTKIEYISPDVAQMYLGKNFDGNRTIRKSWVRKLAAMMREGKFNSLNGQNRIIFGSDGKMYDGQHRMCAIIESGVTLPFEVCISDSATQDYATYDYACAKRSKDLVNIANATNACAIASRIYAIKYGNAPILTVLQGKLDAKTTVSRVQTTEYVNSHEEEVSRLANMANRIRMSIGCGAITVYGTFASLLEYIHDDLYLEDFVNELTNSFSENKTINALRSLIMKSYLNSKRPTHAWLFGVLLCGYHHFKLGDGTTMLNKPTVYSEKYSKYLQAERESRREECAA